MSENEPIWEHPRWQGIAMIAGGVVLILLAGLMGYSGSCQWWAIHQYRQYRFDLFRNYPNSAVSPATLNTAAAAANWYPEDTRVSLCAVDMSEPSEAHFDRLETVVSPGQRRYVSTARNYLRVFHGKETVAFNATSIDDRLVSYMEQINSTERAPLPPFPDFGSDSSPDRYIYLASIERRLKRAWDLGDKTELIAAMGQLSLLAPRHPATEACMFFSVFSREGGSMKMLRNARNRVSNQRIRNRMLRAAAHCFPERAMQALELLGSSATGEEFIAVMRRDGASMTRIVNRTLGLNNPNLAADIFRECIRLGKIDDARVLLDKYRHFNKKQVAALRTTYEKEVQNVKADVRLLQSGFDYAAFHVSTADGKVPRVPIDVMINDLPLNRENQMIRLGSLVHVVVPGAGRFEIRVSIKGKDIFIREVVR